MSVRGIRQPIPPNTVLANIGSVSAQPSAIPLTLLAANSRGALGSGTVTNIATGTGLSGGPITTTGTISLANTLVTPAAYGSASSVATFTVDQQGRLTAASSVAIAIAAGAVSGLATIATTGAITDATGTLLYAHGGTGATSFTNHGVVVAGASALSTVAPGTSANVLTSNGTDWISAAISGKQLTGTTTNDNASAGNVGEIIESEVTAAVALTSGVAADITSISLTAGDWDVWGTVISATSGGSTITLWAGWINTVSATQPTRPGKGTYAIFQGLSAAGGDIGGPVGVRRYSLAAPTTIYLSTIMTFTATMGAIGYIGARRVR